MTLFQCSYSILILLIRRNKNNTPANVIIRTAIALCYYHNLPVEFTDYIFNVEFFNKLDREIQMSTNVSESHFTVYYYKPTLYSSENFHVYGRQWCNKRT